MKKKLVAVIFVFLIVLNIFPDDSKKVDETKTELEDKTKLEDKTELETKTENEKIKKIGAVLNSKNRLRFFSSEEDKLFVENKSDNLNSLTKVYESEMIKKIFDSKMRLEKQIVWGKVSENNYSKLKKIINYTYEIESITPSRIEEDFYSDENFIEIKIVSLFNYLGDKISETKIKFEKDNNEDHIENDVEDNKEDDEKNISEKIIETKQWDYDEENRLIKYQWENEKISSMTKYLYEEGFDNPNEKYFENNILIREKKYKDNNYYIESVYFDDTMSVHSHYEDNLKKLEVCYVNGIEIRRKSF